MSEIKETIVFSGSQNQDDSAVASQNGSWIELFDGLVTNTDTSGKAMTFHTPKGNVAIINSDLPPAEDYKLIFNEYDNVSGNYYYAIKSTANNYHAIWQYRFDTGHVLVLEDPALNFMSKEQVKSVRIVDGKLYWTEGVFNSFGLQENGNFDYSEPKKINIKKAIKYTESGGSDPDGYAYINTSVISACKFPGKYAPTAQYSSDPSRKENALFRKTFQFATQFVYDDDETTVLSPFSKIVFSQKNEAVDGRSPQDITIDNIINITFETGSCAVSQINLCYREGNDGVWIVCEKIDKKKLGIPDEAYYTASFYNNKRLGAVADQYLINNDLLPDIAKLMEYSQAKTIVYGNIHAGYNTTPLTIHPTIFRERITNEYFLNINTSIADYGPYSFYAYLSEFPFDTYAFTVVYCVKFNLYNVLDLPIGTAITLQWTEMTDDTPYTFNNNTYYHTFTTTEEDLQYDTADLRARALVKRVVDEINALNLGDICYAIQHEYNDLPAYYSGITSNPYDVCILIVFRQPDEPGRRPAHVEGTTIVKDLIGFGNPGTKYSVAGEKARSLKTQCNHEYAVIYKRYGNKTNGATVVASNVFVPSGNQELPAGFTAGQYYSSRVFFDIESQPPIEATHYCLAKRRRAPVGSFIQIPIYDVIAYSTQSYMITVDDTYYIRFGATNYYNIEEGDSVSIVLKRVVVSGQPKYQWTQANVTATVKKIIPAGGIDNKLAIIVETHDAFIQFAQAGNIMEIHKIKTDVDDDLFYEIGCDYPIRAAHTTERYHGGESGIVKAFKVETGFGRVYVRGNYIFLNNRSVNFTGFTNNDDDGFRLVNAVYDPDTNLTRLSLTPSLIVGPQDEFPSTLQITYTLDQNNGASAICVDFCGDVYIRPRTFEANSANGATPYGTAYFTCECETVSDYFPSAVWNKGRAQPYYPEAKQVHRYGLFVTSQKYFQDSKINGLSSFLPSGEVELQQTYGEALMLESRGFQLRIGQRKRVSSINIDRQTPTNPNGDTTYILTNTTLGPVDPSERSFGVYRHEASINIDGHIYYWDILNGEIIKDTPGGPFPVTGKMKQFWQAASDFFQKNDATDQVIRFGYNKSSKELLITTYGVLENSPAFTARLNVETDRWCGFYSWLPEMYMMGDNRFFSFKRNTGIFYEHNIGDPNTFFDQAYSPRILFWIKPAADQPKAIRSAYIRSNVVPEFLRAFAEKGPFNTSEQACRAVFEKAPAGYWAYFLNNEFTDGFSSQAVSAIEGSPVVAPFFKIEIVGPAGTSFTVEYIDLYFDIVNLNT